MSFVPLVPLSGYAGYMFLKRTLTAQQAAFSATPEVTRDEDYFRQKIGSVKTAEDLVGDRRLLGVALGAFGLDDDINNKFFLKKVLQDGTLNPDALANRLGSKEYLAFAKAFGFGDFSVPNTQLSDFPDQIITAYKARSFEAAVGQQNDDMRLALNAERELKALADKSSSDETKWFTVMGSAPLRSVFEKALGLPSGFGALDLDQQLSIFRDKSSRAFGDSRIDQFSDPEAMQKLVRTFLIRSEVLSGASSISPAAMALQLLQSR
jgi:hypothetical protein